MFCYIPWYSYLCPMWNGGKFLQVRRSFHLSSPKHESSGHYDPWHQNNLHRAEKVRGLQLVAKMNVCVWVWGGRAKLNLTTSTQTVADLLISVKMFFEKILDLLLIIRQFLWANFNQVLKKRFYLVKLVPFVHITKCHVFNIWLLIEKNCFPVVSKVMDKLQTSNIRNNMTRQS